MYHSNYFLLNPIQAHLVYAQLPIIAMYGRNEADLLQLLHYWLQKNPKVIDGQPWIYNTYQEWHEQLPYLSVSTIRRAFDSLKAKGVVFIEKFDMGIETDNTRWFSIDYQIIARDFPNPLINQSAQNEQTVNKGVMPIDTAVVGEKSTNPLINQSAQNEQTGISNTYEENAVTPLKLVCSFWTDGSPIEDPRGKIDETISEENTIYYEDRSRNPLINQSAHFEQIYIMSSRFKEKEKEKGDGRLSPFFENSEDGKKSLHDDDTTPPPLSQCHSCSTEASAFPCQYVERLCSACEPIYGRKPKKINRYVRQAVHEYPLSKLLGAIKLNIQRKNGKQDGWTWLTKVCIPDTLEELVNALEAKQESKPQRRTKAMT